jgi:hypothetical protein
VYVNIADGKTLTIDGANANFSACKVILNASTVNNRGIVTFVNTTSLILSSAWLSGYAIKFNIPPTMQFTSNFSAIYMGGCIFNATGTRTNSVMLLQHGAFTELNNVSFTSENPMPVPFITNNEALLVTPGPLAYTGSPNLRKLVSQTGNIIGPNTGRLSKELIYVPTAYLFKSLTAAEWTDLKAFLSTTPQGMTVNINAATNKPGTGPSETTLEFWSPHAYYVFVRATIVVSSTNAERGDSYIGYWADSSGSAVWQGWKKSNIENQWIEKAGVLGSNAQAMGTTRIWYNAYTNQIRVSFYNFKLAASFVQGQPIMTIPGVPGSITERVGVLVNCDIYSSGSTVSDRIPALVCWETNATMVLWLQGTPATGTNSKGNNSALYGETIITL